MSFGGANDRTFSPGGDVAPEVLMFKPTTSSTSTHELPFAPQPHPLMLLPLLVNREAKGTHDVSGGDGGAAGELELRTRAYQSASAVGVNPSSTDG
jgi:hypothetical protein